MLYKFLHYYSASALKKFDPFPTAAFHGPAEFRGWSNRNGSRNGADFTPYNTWELLSNYPAQCAHTRIVHV